MKPISKKDRAMGAFIAKAVGAAMIIGLLFVPLALTAGNVYGLSGIKRDLATVGVWLAPWSILFAVAAAYVGNFTVAGGLAFVAVIGIILALIGYFVDI